MKYRKHMAMAVFAIIGAFLLGGCATTDRPTTPAQKVHITVSTVENTLDEFYRQAAAGNVSDADVARVQAALPAWQAVAGEAIFLARNHPNDPTPERIAAAALHVLTILEEILQ